MLHVLHVMLFMTMVIYVVVVCVMFCCSNWSRKGWSKIERFDRSKKLFVNLFICFFSFHGTFSYINKHLEAIIAEYDDLHKSQPFYSYFSPFYWHKVSINAERYLYQQIRYLFIHKNGLKPDFRFDIYMRKCARKILATLVEIHWSVWIGIVV
jgi:hypothetical protein